MVLCEVKQQGGVMQPEVDYFPIAAHPVVSYTTAVGQHLAVVVVFFEKRTTGSYMFPWLNLCLVLWNVLDCSYYCWILTALVNLILSFALRFFHLRTFPTFNVKLHNIQIKCKRIRKKKKQPSRAFKLWAHFLCTAYFISPHRLLVVFRSGVWLGHSETLIFSFLFFFLDKPLLFFIYLFLFKFVCMLWVIAMLKCEIPVHLQLTGRDLNVFALKLAGTFLAIH